MGQKVQAHSQQNPQSQEQTLCAWLPGSSERGITHEINDGYKTEPEVGAFCCCNTFLLREILGCEWRFLEGPDVQAHPRDPPEEGHCSS